MNGKQEERCDNIRGIADKLDRYIFSPSFSKILLRIFFIIFVFQCGSICFYNLFQLKEHLGYDASVDILQAVEMWRSKSFILDNWVYTTSLKLDSGIPLTALLYGITGNVFLSFGIVNIATTAIMVLLFCKIAEELGLSPLATLIALNMFLSPYTGESYNVANPLDYYSCMFFSCAYYAVSVITVLLAVLAVLRLERNDLSRGTLVCVCSSLFLFAVAGISKGMTMMMYFALPGLLYALVLVFLNNTFDGIFCKRNLYFILVIAATLIGVVIAAVATSYQNRSGEMQLIGFEGFWENFGALLLGLPILMDVGTTGTWVGATSYRAIPFFCNLLLFVLFAFSLIFIAVRYFKAREYKADTKMLFMLCLCFVDIFIFALIDSKAGSPIFEARYLIFAFVCGLFLVGGFIDAIKDSLVFKKLLICFIACALVASNATSYFCMTYRSGAWGAELVDVFSKYDVEVVYVMDHPEASTAIQGRNLRVLDTSKVYKVINSYLQAHHWGDYTYYDDVSDVPEGGVLLYIKTEELEKWPECIRNSFVLKEKLADADVYYSEKAVFDLVSGLPKYSDHSTDLPTSPSIWLGNGELAASGAFVSNGAEGYVFTGPYETTPSKAYDIKLNYNVVSLKGQSAGRFEIAVNGGERVLVSEDITPDAVSVTLRAEFTEGDVFVYRVYCADGAVIEINSVEMTCVSE